MSISVLDSQTRNTIRRSFFAEHRSQPNLISVGVAFREGQWIVEAETDGAVELPSEYRGLRVTRDAGVRARSAIGYESVSA